MKTVRAAMLVVAMAMLLIPAVASASLLGDTVSVTLTAGASVIFNNVAAVVTDPGLEFSTTFEDADWKLDILDNGFRLDVECLAIPNDTCKYPDGVTLTISGLDFTPPATLIGLTAVDHDIQLVPALPPPDNPAFTPSSVSIVFQDFELNTGPSDTDDDNKTAFYEATFVTQPQQQQQTGVPLPGTLALLSIGLGLVAVALRRIRS